MGVLLNQRYLMDQFGVYVPGQVILDTSTPGTYYVEARPGSIFKLDITGAGGGSWGRGWDLSTNAASACTAGSGAGYSGEFTLKEERTTLRIVIGAGGHGTNNGEASSMYTEKNQAVLVAGGGVVGNSGLDWATGGVGGTLMTDSNLATFSNAVVSSNGRTGNGGHRRYTGTVTVQGAASILSSIGSTAGSSRTISQYAPSGYQYLTGLNGYCKIIYQG